MVCLGLSLVCLVWLVCEVFVWWLGWVWFGFGGMLWVWGWCVVVWFVVINCLGMGWVGLACCVGFLLCFGFGFWGISLFCEFGCCFVGFVVCLWMSGLLWFCGMFWVGWLFCFVAVLRLMLVCVLRFGLVCCDRLGLFCWWLFGCVVCLCVLMVGLHVITLCCWLVGWLRFAFVL